MKKFKNVIAIFMTCIMIISSMCSLNISKVFAEELPISVNIRIEANDHTIISEKEIEVDNFDLKPYGADDNKNSVRAIHAVIKALESENVDCSNPNSFESRGCTYIENIVGVKQGSVSSNDGWMFYINNNYVPEYIGDAKVKDGDSIVVFFQEDYQKNTYSWFEQNSIKIQTGENITLKLLGLKYDVNSNESKKVVVNDAKILVNNQEYIVNGKYVNTDNEGNATLKFDNEGIYEISAVRFNKDTGRRDISRPYCKIIVEKGNIKLDKTSLINSISEGEKILNNANIGKEIGQYPQRYKEMLQDEIKKAKNILNVENLAAEELNKTNIELQNAILKFKESIIKNESLQRNIDDVITYYATWKDNAFKSFDFITSMALRRAGVSTDELLNKINIYGMGSIHNNSRNVMNIIGAGKDPKDYKGKDYTEFLIDYNYDNEDNAEYIAKAIIALDMANVEYDKEKVVGTLLNKAHEDEGKFSFGKISPGYWDDFMEEMTDDEYMPYIDATAWSLIALSNHTDIKNTKEVIDGVKRYLKSNQNKHGLIENSSDTALVIQGLIALGENPNEEYWCINDGNKKVSMVDGIIKCKKDNQFMLQVNSAMASDIATSQVLAALVDLNTMTSMYKKLRYEDISIPVKLQIYGEKEVYNGGKLNLQAKAFDYNHVVIKDAAISWKSSDESIAIVKNGVVEALKEGEVEIIAYITGSETIKDSIEIKVITPPQIDYSEKLNAEIDFLKNHYIDYKSYEFLASPAAVIAGINKDIVKEGIFRYSKNTTALQNAKTIITFLGAGLDPRHDNVKGQEINYVENLEKAQVLDGLHKGKFVINKGSDENSIETQAYCIIALDMVKGNYNKELAVKALLNLLNDSNYKNTDLMYKHIKTEAIAVTALANHKNIAGAENKINELIEFFKVNQNADGAFDMKAGSTYVNSPIATGAVVQALLANGIDPLSWQWTKGGKTILDGMLKSKFEGRVAATSGYSQGEGLNFENTEATYYAFSSLVQMLNKKSIFNMIKEEVVPKDYIKEVKQSIESASAIILKSKIEDWDAIGLSAVGKNIPEVYLKDITEIIKNRDPKLFMDGKFRVITDCERTIIGVIAAGGDPRNIGNYNLLDDLYSRNLEKETNIYTLAYGLLALDAGKFNIPNNATFTREKIIDRIIQLQYDDGGWGMFSSSDPDSTAMMLIGLSSYKKDPKVQSSIDKAVEFLSKKQNNNGGYTSSWDKNLESSESASQAIIALCALGIDPTSDNFTKNNNNLIDFLFGFKTTDGGFAHERDDLSKSNPMATQQALQAFGSYKNFKEGKIGSIYLFKEFKDDEKEVKEVNIKNITKAKEFKLGEEAKIAVEATNNSKIDKKASVIIALYDNNNKIIDYLALKNIIKSGEKVELEGMMSLPKSGQYKVKAFVWDSLEEMNSFSEVIEIPVK